MKIHWLGHSSFKLVESTGSTVITDPFDGNIVGFDMEKVCADIVTVSHEHNDHNFLQAVEGSPTIIDTAGAYELKGVHIIGLESFHDPECGKLRGNNLIYKIRMDGVDICHLGDLGEECNSDLAESIGSVNVLLIPVGGTFTIDAEQAKEYVDFLMPDFVIPMHFKTSDCILNIDKIDDFLKLFEDEQIVYVNDEMEFDRADFEGETTKVLVFENFK